MYPAYAKWIRSHRDLPLKLNQWSNVVRWEFSNPTPFIRTREFLWQEGHSAFATYEEAQIEVLQILELYAQVYQDLLAVPVIKGKKTEKEKFAGGLYTTTVEAFVPSNGRGIQGATSHCLGQNFAKMFDISFETETKQKQLVWQNSWGITTRTIGVMVMIHGDDKGLVLPPRIAPTQIVLVPIYFKDKETLKKQCQLLKEQLQGIGARVEVDERENYTPGWKFNHWELKGVPLRIELGPRDLEAKQVVVVQRYDGAKHTVSWKDLNQKIPLILQAIQKGMFDRALDTLKKRIISCKTWDEFLQALDARSLALSLWCGSRACEEDIKFRSGQSAKEEKDGSSEENRMKLTGAAKSLCVPFDQPELPTNAKCVGCGKTAVSWTLFGRSY